MRQFYGLQCPVEHTRGQCCAGLDPKTQKDAIWMDFEKAAIPMDDRWVAQ